ncbi:hypothetical protein AGMMS50230_11590 [Spirochaetia bacterium]|nr:hypothetical protein AGMMS50230_11590 [Spirochaetia bacterium]
MKKLSIFLAALVLCACAGSPGANSGADPGAASYYVSAAGSDRSDGLSEETPFRSLFKAMTMAAGGPVKTITVIGTLNETSELSTNKERIFLLQGTGDKPVLICGKNSGGEPAVLSAAGSKRRVVLVRGTVPVRFENIEISGGEASGEGGGIGIGPGSSVTLGPGTVIRDNRAENIGGGVLVAPGGSLFIEGGRILGNRSAAHGGGVAVVGSKGVILFRDGEISGNQATGGGGAAVFQGSTFTLSGGIVTDNAADLAGGGIMVNQAEFAMDGGIIRGNNCSGSGGGIALLNQGSFLFTNGEIRENRAAEHGGGIASDDTSSIQVQGGFIAANQAASRGGGVFSAGSFAKSGGKIYGTDVPRGEANTAASGAAVFIFRGEGQNKTREQSAGEDLELDASTGEGWIAARE